MSDSAILVPAPHSTARQPPQRHLRAAIEEDLATKMIFIGGPRQVGKTSLARSLVGASAAELNFDVGPQRAMILSGELPQVGTCSSTRSTNTEDGATS